MRSEQLGVLESKVDELRTFVGPASTVRTPPDLVARLPTRNGQLNKEIVHGAGLSEMQWEAAV